MKGPFKAVVMAIRIGVVIGIGGAGEWDFYRDFPPY